MAAIVKKKYIWESSFGYFRRVDILGRKSSFVTYRRTWWDLDKVKRQRERNESE